MHYIDIICTAQSARDGGLVAEVGGTSSNCQDKAWLARAARGRGRVLCAANRARQ